MKKVFILMDSDGMIDHAFSSLEKVRKYIYDKYDNDLEAAEIVWSNLEKKGYDIDAEYDLLETNLD